MSNFPSGPAYENDICKACIKRYKNTKGDDWKIDCCGIVVEEDVKTAIREEGISEHDARWLFDPKYFFETVYGSPTRWYQDRILYCSSKQLAGRQCRQTGKSLLFIAKILHYVLTNENVTVLIVGPFENVIRKIYDEYILRDFVYKSSLIKNSVTSKSMSPHYNISFDNGSKISLMIAGPGCRGQSADWLYIDESTMIATETLNDIIMTVAGKGAENAVILMTSTPKGRGLFYEVCKVDPTWNEFHVSIYDVKEMENMIDRFKNLLRGGFKEECEAEFGENDSGPFSFQGISLAKQNYQYEDCIREDGWLYFGGVDWNGPNIGTYFYVIGFNPEAFIIRCVEKKIVSSQEWNSTLAKQTFIELNRKWKPNKWMVDAGYSSAICEELKYWSTYKLPSGLPGNHPDAMVKHILEPVEFGGWVYIKDPFTREEIKKTTRAFMVSQISRLFEVENGNVPIMFPKDDNELIKSLENYRLLAITDKGVEKYGFEKKSGMEDHCYTPDHEILTRDGWKFISEVTLNDELAAPDKYGRLKYEKPSRIICNNYNGELITVNTRGISYKVTDKHRLTYIKGSDYRNLSNGWELKADILEDAPWFLPTFAAAFDIDDDGDEYPISDEEIYLLGMFLSEGCTNINHHHYRTMWFQKKEPQVTKIRNALQEVYPGIFSETIDKKTKVKRFKIQKIKIYNKFKKYGKCDQKYIDREYLDKFSKRQLRLLFEALMDGDGHWCKSKCGGSHYDSTSWQLINDVQEICFKIGIQTTLQKLKIPKDKPHYKQSYRIGITKTRPIHHYQKRHIKREKYNGKVYCATVSDGFLVIRHNGKVHIGSNCIDSFNLAIYGIIKHFSHLFEQMFLFSVPFDGKAIFSLQKDTEKPKNVPEGSTIILITSEDNTPISIDDSKIKNNIEEEIISMSRTFNRNIERNINTNGITKRRNNYMVSRSLNI